MPDTLWKFVWFYLKDKKLYLWGSFIVSLVWSVEMAVSPYLLKIIIDSVARHSDNMEKMMAAVLVPAIIYVLMSVMLNFTFRFYEYICLNLYPRLKLNIVKDMFTYLMGHSYSFFQNNFSGSLSKKIFDMAVNIESVIRIPNEFFYPRTMALVVSSGMLFFAVHPAFSIILLVWAVVFVWVSYKASKTLEQLSWDFSGAANKMDGVVVDSVTNVLSTKLFSNIEHEVGNLDKHLSDLTVKDRALQWQTLKVYFVQVWGVTVLVGSMLFTLIYGRLNGWVSVGDFALVLMLTISFMWVVFNIGQEMLRFSKVVGVCKQALSLIVEPHEVVDLPDAADIKIDKGEVVFKEVSFAYENQELLFEGLNIVVKAGEKVGLVGFSGGGKSTFFKLILRLMDVGSGHIYIDGNEVKDFKKNSLRRQISTIPQETNLFHRSIMENIRFARPEASDEDVINAAQMAHCHEFICELKEGYQSLVGERGIKLSGGQKQRISIARSFLQEAPILLLDEATSSLDSLTEQYIQKGLREVMKNKTTIVIAHRLSTLKGMDRIVVIENGKVVEDGVFEELLSNQTGSFYQLWKMQSEGFIPTIDNL